MVKNDNEIATNCKYQHVLDPSKTENTTILDY